MMPGPPERLLEVSLIRGTVCGKYQLFLETLKMNSVMKHNSCIVSGTRAVKRRAI